MKKRTHTRKRRPKRRQKGGLTHMRKRREKGLTPKRRQKKDPIRIMALKTQSERRQKNDEIINQRPSLFFRPTIFSIA
jgi:hypothetical protein